MARFFKGEKPQLVEDFMYQPPWELMATALAKSNEEIQKNANHLELLRGINMDYDSVHADAAKRIKSEIDSEIDNLSVAISKDPLNPNNRRAIADLRKKFKERFETGDIYNIQQTARNLRDLETKIDTEIEDQDTRQKYKQLLVQGYRDGNPEGLTDEFFNYQGELYDHRDFANEFFNSALFKNLGKNSSKSTWMEKDQKEVDKSGESKYIYTISSAKGGLPEDELKKAWETWAKENIPKGYMDSRENEVFGEIWRDEDGNISFGVEGTEPKKAWDIVKNAVYKQTEYSKVENINPVWMKDRENAGQRRAEIERTLGADYDASFLYSTAEGKKVLDAMINTIEAYLTVQGKNPNQSMEDYLKMVKLGIEDSQDPETVKRLEAVIETVENIKKTYNSEMRAGLGSFLDVMTEKDLKFLADLKNSNQLEAVGLRTRGYLKAGDRPDINDKLQQNKINLIEYIGRPAKELLGDEFKNEKILEIKPLEGLTEFIPAASISASGEPEWGAEIKYDLILGAEGSVDRKIVPVSYYISGDQFRLLQRKQ